MVRGNELKKGDRWECSATPSDGTADGPIAKAEATVANSEPTPPGIELIPAQPKQGQGLGCRIVTAAQDPDGDTVNYRFEWFKNGARQTFATTTTEVPARLVKAGEIWSCAVIPNDGTANGKRAQSPVALVTR